MKKKVIISVLFLIVFALFTSESVSAKYSEIEAVRTPLESYLMGHKTGEAKYMKIAMHTEGKLMFIRNGKYTTIDFPSYIARMKPRIAKDEAQRERYIESIEVTGNVAVAKLIIKYPTVHFTDYMTLMKMNGKWKITNKVAYSVRDPKNNKAERPDIEAARVPLQQFIKSLATAKIEPLKKAVHSDGKLMFMYNNKFRTISFPKYIKDFPRKLAKDESQRKRRIESIQVTGNIGIGKLVLEYPTVKFTDYMTLMKIGGEWKITNKASNMEFPPKDKK